MWSRFSCPQIKSLHRKNTAQAFPFDVVMPWQPETAHAQQYWRDMKGLPKAPAVETAFSDFMNDVKEDRIMYVHISQDLKQLTARTTEQIDEHVNLPRAFDIIETLLENDIPVDVLSPPKTDEVMNWAPIIFQILVFYIMYRYIASMSGGNGGIRGFLKSKSDVNEEPTTGITFADVAGVDNAKVDLLEVVDFLKTPEKYSVVGAKVPKGVILHGPPGTGKTLLAKAVAGEAGVPFISCSGSEFIEMFVGVGASRLRDLFAKARQKAPCIIFIDEIDAIGKARGGVNGTPGNDERDQTINQLLTMMDGFEDNAGVIVMAATNRLDILDEALLRPGRFDRRVSVELPDLKGRHAIMKVHANGKPLCADVSLESWAKVTVGFSGAELANLINEAAIYAARYNSSEIKNDHFELALEKMILGEEKRSLVLTEQKKYVLAIHESGHTLMAMLVNNYDTVRKVSIVPRGRSGGATYFEPSEHNIDLALMTREYLENRIMVALGGRIAEEIVFGRNKVTTGASGDFMEVHKLAMQMVTQFGFNENLGAMYLGDARDSKEVYNEMKLLVDKLYEKATTLMKEQEFYLHRLAEALMIKETLSAEEVIEYTKGMACFTSK